MRASFLVRRASAIVTRKETWWGIASCHSNPLFSESEKQVCCASESAVSSGSAYLVQPSYLQRLGLPIVRSVSSSASSGESATAGRPRLDAREPTSDDFHSVPSLSSVATVSHGAGLNTTDGGHKQAVLVTMDASEKYGDTSAASAPVSSVSNAAGKDNEVLDLEQIVNELEKAMKGNKMVPNILLWQLREYEGPWQPGALDSVMSMCSKKGRSRVAQELINIMETKGVKRASDHFHLLQSLSIDGKFIEVWDHLMAAGEKHKVDPMGGHLDPSMLNVVLMSAAANKRLSVYEDAVEFMKTHNVKPNARTHVELIAMAGFNQDPAKVRAKWGEVSAEYSEQSPIALQSGLVMGLARAGAILEARLALEQMKDTMFATGWEPASGKDPDLVKRAYDGLIAASVLEGDEDLVYQLLKERDDLGFKYNVVLRSNLHLGAAANAGNWDKVYELVAFMRREGRAINQVTYAALISGRCKLDDVPAAMELLATALRRNVENMGMFETIAHACFRLGRHGRLETMLQWMDHAKNTTPMKRKYFALLIKMGMDVSEKGLSESELLRRISQLKLHSGVWHSSSSLHAQVWALSEAGSIAKIMECMKRGNALTYYQRWPLANTLIYNTAIHACCRHGKMEEMHQLLDMMREDGILDISLHRLKQEIAFANVDLPSALTVLKALRESGRSPDLFVFNFLIQVVSHAGNLDAGLSLLSEMEEAQVQPDSQTLTTLLFYAAHHRKFKVVEQLVERIRLRSFSFPPDADMCLAVISAYVKSRRHRDALQAMQIFRERLSAFTESSTPSHESNALKDASVPLVVDFERLRELIERGTRARELLHLRGALKKRGGTTISCTVKENQPGAA